MFATTFASVTVDRQFNIVIDGIIVPFVSACVDWFRKDREHFGGLILIF